VSGLELVLAEPLLDGALLRAIALMRDRHFPALSLVNALAGMQTPEWRAIHQHGRAKLFAEARRRGLVIPDRAPCPCCGEYGAADPGTYEPVVARYPVAGEITDPSKIGRIR
jgi:hypothetical protein